MIIQQNLFGESKIAFHCCKCEWSGYDPDIVNTNLEACPKCGWAAFSDHEVQEMIEFSNDLYPRTKVNYRRFHKRK